MRFVNGLKGVGGCLLALMAVGTAWGLEIGDKAPAVKVEKWLNGEGQNPAAADGKNVYVVELWATWCAPCRQTVPHLNDLYEKLKAKGLVVIGLTTEDEAKVKPFLEKLPMKYLVGLDTKEECYPAYMDGGQGIPHSVVVNQQGVVVWTGHPQDGLEKVVQQVLAGTYDLEKAKKVQQLQNEFAQVEEVADGLKILDQLIALEPEKTNYRQVKALLHKQAENPALAQQAYLEWFNACGDDPVKLADFANQLIDERQFAYKNPKLAIEAARKASELTQGREATAVVALARAYLDAGLMNKALIVLQEAQKQKVEAAAIKEMIEYMIQLAEVLKQYGD